MAARIILPRRRWRSCHAPPTSTPPCPVAGRPAAGRQGGLCSTILGVGTGLHRQFFQAVTGPMRPGGNARLAGADPGIVERIGLIEASMPSLNRDHRAELEVGARRKVFFSCSASSRLLKKVASPSQTKSSERRLRPDSNGENDHNTSFKFSSLPSFRSKESLMPTANPAAKHDSSHVRPLGPPSTYRLLT